MKAETRHRIDRLLVLGLGLFIIVGCGQTNSCSCSCGVPGATYPTDGLVVPQGMQIRLTPQGIESLEAAVVPLIESQLAGGMGGMGGGLSFCLGAQTGGSPEICYNGEMCDDGSPGCQLDMGIGAVDIVPMDNGMGGPGADPADGVSMKIDIDTFDETLSVSIQVLVTLNCVAHMYLDPGQVMSLTADVALPVDSMTQRTGVEYLGSDLDISNLNLDISGSFGCGLGNIGFVQDLFIGQLTGQFDPIIEDTLNGFLCTPCEEMTNACPGGSMCDTDSGLCMVAQDQCLMNPLGAEGGIDIGEVLSGFGSGEPAILYYSLFAANYADAVGDGLSLGFETGATSEYNDCVPLQPPPDATAVPRSMQLETDLTPMGGIPFDAGIGISEKFLEHAMWALYNNGTLCIEVDSSTVPQLSTATLGILLMSLGDLTNNENRPVLIKLQPKQAPTVLLGAGTVMDDGMGNFSVVDPLLTIELHNLDIDMYAFVFDRYARILTVNADVDIPIALTQTPQNELIPVVGDIALPPENVRIRNSELLADDPETIAGLLPSLIAGFLPSLLGSLSEPIAIPDLAGFQLEIVESTGIDNNTIMALYANLSYTPTGMLTASADTRVVVESIETPAKDYMDGHGHVAWAEFDGNPRELTPIVQLALDGTSPNGDTLEYSYRVDNSPWSYFTTETTRRVQHPSLMLPGHHVIEVMARTTGDYHTADPTPESVEVVIDWIPPAINELRTMGTAVQVLASDDVAMVGELQYRHRVRGKSWSAWSGSNAIELASFAGERIKVDYEVMDTAGNVGSKTDAITVAGVLSPRDVETAEPPSEGGCQCATTRTSSDEMPFGVGVILFLIGGIFAWRRRYSGLAVLLAVIFAGGINMGCDDSAAKDDDPCGGLCTAEETCVDGTCVAMNECEMDGDCMDGQACVNGQCQSTGCADATECPACVGGGEAVCVNGGCMCATPCDGSCPDGQYCCNSEDMCRPLPDECGGMACDPGFVAQVSSPGVGDPNTCTATDPVCECMELPPLSMGQWGLYTNISAEGQLVAVSAYSKTYGDLMIGLADTAGAVTWEFVEGVPTDAAVEYKIDGPRGGISERGADVGKYSDIVVAADGTLYVSYQDVDNEALRFAIGTSDGNGGYTWAFHNVDADGRTGMWTSVSLDAQGFPGIAYMTLERDNMGATVTELRFAQATSAQPAADTDWTIATLSQLDLSGPCGMPCASGSFCRLDTTVCEAPVDAMQCADTCGSDEQCFAGGNCVNVQVVPTIAAWEPGVGLHTQHVRFADGRAAVVAYDSINGNGLLSIESTPGMFTTSVFAGELMDGTDTGVMGLYPSIAVDSGDNIHVTYVDWNRKDLMYLNVSSTATEVVDDGTRIDAFGPSLNFVGDDASMWMVNDVPTIAYQDSTSLQLVLAQQDMSGSFVQTVIAGEGRDATFDGSYGFYADHDVEGGQAYMINFVINQQARPSTFEPVLHTATLQ